MSKLTTIGLIALAALLVVVGTGIVLADTPVNHPEPLGPLPPSAPPPFDVAEAPLLPELLPPEVPVPSVPPPSDPTEGAEPGKVITIETLHRVGTTDPDTGERIDVQTTVRTGISNPWKVGPAVHGSAYTHATHVPGVSTTAIVQVALWWWDGAEWRQRALASDIDTSPWLGWYRAEATPVAVGETGFWAATAVHRVYRNGVRYHFSTSESGYVYLTFP